MPEVALEGGLEKRLQSGEPVSWDEFLDSYAATIHGLVHSAARTYDERMDLFLFVCQALAADDMRRVRVYRFRPDAPCRFTTYLSVVVRNLIRDFYRSRRGRFRLYASIAKLDTIDRLILVYRFQEDRSLDDLVRTLETRHGIRLPTIDLAGRIAHVEKALSPSQRWRFLARRAWQRPRLRIDPMDAVVDASKQVSLTAHERGPEESLGSADAERAFTEAVGSMSGRQQLVLALRFRDGLDVATTARALDVSAVQVERLTREALRVIRDALFAARVTRDDLEGALGATWVVRKDRADA